MPVTIEPRQAQHTSVRLSQHTLDRIAKLRQLYAVSTSTIVAMAVDRLWTEEGRYFYPQPDEPKPES